MASAFAVPAAVAVTVGFTEADQLFSGKGFTMKPVIGGFLLGLFLYGISELDSGLGAIFATLVVVNAIIRHGGTVFGKLVKK